MYALRLLLYPLSLIYALVLRVRNFLFDQKIINTQEYDLPVIGVGNLSTGGTGKSPMTEYLIKLVGDHSSTATLSRGYGRKTKGFRWVEADDSAEQSGDEPLQFAYKFPHIKVAVDESRKRGMQHLLNLDKPPEMIILDDVYQHRAVKPGFLILLTAHNQPFYKDHVLPAGNLRESRDGAKRAHAVVVTKCPSQISEGERNSIALKIAKYTKAPVFFSKITYGKKIYGKDEQLLTHLQGQRVTVVTGIAKPEYLIDFLKAQDIQLEHLRFSDHHNFKISEIELLRSKPIILTTEKDFMRLKEYNLKQLYYLPIETEFIDGTAFDKLILNFAGLDFQQSDKRRY